MYKLQGEMNGSDEEVMKSLLVNLEMDVNGSRTKWITEYAAELFMRGCTREQFLQFVNRTKEDRS